MDLLIHRVLVRWLLLWAALTLVGWLLRAARRPATTPRPPLVPAPRRLAAVLADAGVPTPADQLFSAWVAGLVGVAAVLAATAGAGAAVVAAASGIAAPLLVLAGSRDRVLRAVDAALPDVLDAVARSLRSGATLRGALGEAAGATTGRLGDDLTAVVAEADGGVPLAAALDGWRRRCPTPGVRLAAAALALAAEAGGASAQAVDGVAATVRSNQAVAAEVRAQSSQAWLSALVIGLAPLAFTTLAAGTDTRTLEFLLRTRLGLACLTVGLALDGVALWWMRRLTAGVA